MKIHIRAERKEGKEQRQLFKIDRSYKTRSKITKRTIAISEAFGIGVDDEKTFSIFKNFEIEINPGQVVLITGDSGSGKSTLLSEIYSQMSGAREFPNGLIVNAKVEIDPNQLLVEGVGRDISEAISILSMAGLNEAFLMLRKFKELSDGQKYRYRLAKMIESEADVWCFDEFCAVLDRTTAKVVSYCVQKTARRLGKTLIVATTHGDLFNDLKPDLWVEKSFGDSVVSRNYRADQFSKKCTVLDSLRIESCQLNEIKPLERFHYRGSRPGVIRKVFKATIGGELAAGITYVFAYPALRARNLVFEEFRGKSSSALMRRVNRSICRISRVIVSPKFRSVGLGEEIVRRTLPLAPTKYTSYCLTSKRASEPVPLNDAILWVLNDYELNDDIYLPSVDLLVLLDVLHILDRSGPQNVLELLNRLRTLHSSRALSKYLGSLLHLRMVSRKEIKYRGAIPVKAIYDITENGKILLSIIEKTS